jgi:hypothetical protein
MDNSFGGTLTPKLANEEKEWNMVCPRKEFRYILKLCTCGEKTGGYSGSFQ